MSADSPETAETETASSPALAALELPEDAAIWPRGPGPDGRFAFCAVCSWPFATAEMPPTIDPDEHWDGWAEIGVVGVNGHLCRNCSANASRLPSRWFSVRADHDFDVFVYRPPNRHWPHDHLPTFLSALPASDTTPPEFGALTNHEQQVVAAIATGNLQTAYDQVDNDELHRSLLASIEPRTDLSREVETNLAVPQYPTPLVVTTGGVFTPHAGQLIESLGSNAVAEAGDEESTSTAQGELGAFC